MANIIFALKFDGISRYETDTKHLGKSIKITKKLHHSVIVVFALQMK